ncbi:MAG: 16S rRNA (guanine(966)-N(2))-methyltransferase RsmD [Alphaproteobacteria bacterium]|nr:16S rRNA (guanine(966)-N(2))-methyltransferase RsmD [Alphaproteobacteria bacterium]
MRIVAGEFGGRRLKTPAGRDIRPTSDKIRGAIFNALRARGAVAGASVIDAFCGTGALGLEALSQGAAQCLFIDKDRAALDLALQNVQDLGVDDRCGFLKADSAKLPLRSTSHAQATLVFLDPPYGKNFIAGALHSLQAGDWLAPQAWIVMESEKYYIYEGLTPFFDKTYGQTRICIAQYSAWP